MLASARFERVSQNQRILSITIRIRDGVLVVLARNNYENRLNVAQLGCGYWGPNLLRNFVDADHCDVMMVVEQSRERRDFVKDRYPKIAVSTDWHDALDDPDIDVIAIATPAASHFDLGLAALQAGKHIFVEKPLAMNVAEVDALDEAAKIKDLTIMVGHTCIYNPAVVSTREIIRSGELGQTLHIQSRRLGLGQVRSDINAWWNLAPHDLSMLVYLSDDVMPSKITATGGAFLIPGIYDMVFANLEWDNGVKASIHVSWLDPTRVRTLSVVGDKKMLTFDDIADDRLVVHDRRIDINNSNGRTTAVYRNEGTKSIPLSNDEPLRIEVDHFIESVRTGTQPETGIRHARDIVALLEAGQQSLDTGQPSAIRV